jgi:N-acetylmuramoyl-L-alanine amidase
MTAALPISGILRKSDEKELLSSESARKGFSPQNIKDINTIVIHATDTPDEWDDKKALGSVNDWHVNKQKWNAIGYHYLIGKDGDIYVARNPTERGAHAKNYNKNSLGIAFIGTGKNPTQAQKDALRSLSDKINSRVGSVKYTRHRDIDPGRRSDVPFDITDLTKKRGNK